MAIVLSDRGVGYFPSYILYRISKNKNFLGCITGQTGSGKSYSALKLGQVLDPDFDVRNVCFTPKEFLDLVKGNTKKMKKGSCILWDEMQISMSHLDYQNLQAKLINFVLQTFRYKGFVLLITAPHFSFLNASCRKLFHSRMETISINPNEKVCTLKPFLLQTNQDSGQIYRKYLRVKIEDGVAPIKEMGVGLPTKELLVAYEEKKDKFTTELYDDISNELEEMEGKQPNKPLTKKQKEIADLLVKGKIVSEIAEILGITDKLIWKQMTYIRKKGISIESEKEGAKVVRYEVQGYNSGK